MTWDPGVLMRTTIDAGFAGNTGRGQQMAGTQHTSKHKAWQRFETVQPHKLQSVPRPTEADVGKTRSVLSELPEGKQKGLPNGMLNVRQQGSLSLQNGSTTRRRGWPQ